MASSVPQGAGLPHIHLLTMCKPDAAAWRKFIAQEQLEDVVSYTSHECSLALLDSTVTFDLVVSPANSYGFLDGAFDDAISRAWSPPDNYYALTKAVQAQLYDWCRGYLPPGECFIASIPTEYPNPGRYGHARPRYIAMCPTMRLPEDVNWDREVVYNCIWSLLNAIRRHNSTAADEAQIRSILMTPLATGIGRVPADRWAHQTVLAIKHFIHAQREPEVWSQLDWTTAESFTTEVETTHQ